MLPYTTVRCGVLLCTTSHNGTLLGTVAYYGVPWRTTAYSIHLYTQETSSRGAVPHLVHDWRKPFCSMSATLSHTKQRADTCQDGGARLRTSCFAHDRVGVNGGW
eukprot:9190839-Alexandrium_andersonii.AAC.1